ncbi:MAG: DUF4249 family protein [Bacteroidetes bacterium]|nr:DUF4249 family protein [Bacteroidota bacterium]
MKSFKIIQIILSTTLLFLTACEDSELNFKEQVIPVVQAYLYSKDPVDDIRLTKMINYAMSDTMTISINDANIIIRSEGEIYELVASEGDSGYYFYPGDDLVVAPNKKFELEFEYHGEKISAETVVPDTPPQANISEEVLYMDQVNEFGDMMYAEWPDPIEITWENPNNDYYFFMIENVEENPDDIITFEMNFRGRFFFRSQPTNADYYTIQTRTLTQFGRYRVKIYVDRGAIIC